MALSRLSGPPRHPHTAARQSRIHTGFPVHIEGDWPAQISNPQRQDEVAGLPCAPFAGGPLAEVHVVLIDLVLAQRDRPDAGVVLGIAVMQLGQRRGAGTEPRDRGDK